MKLYVYGHYTIEMEYVINSDVTGYIKTTMEDGLHKWNDCLPISIVLIPSDISTLYGKLRIAHQVPNSTVHVEI
jgi:hypothetical protein